MFRHVSGNIVGFASTPNLQDSLRNRVPESTAMGYTKRGESSAGTNNSPISLSNEIDDYDDSFDFIGNGLQQPSKNRYSHSKEPSGSTTYNVLEYYCNGDKEAEHDGDACRIPDMTAGTSGIHGVHGVRGIDEINGMSGMERLKREKRVPKSRHAQETNGSIQPLVRDNKYGGDTLVYGGTDEPFTFISGDNLSSADSSSGATAPKPMGSRHITKKESYASLEKTRSSFEVVRNEMNKSMVAEDGHKDGGRKPLRINLVHGTSKNRILQSKEDRYGFKKTSTFISEEDYNDWWKKYSKYLIRRKHKWEKMMEKNGLSVKKAEAPRRFPPKSSNLARFVHKGIPAEWRGAAWFYFARGNEKIKQNPGVYNRLVDQTIDIINDDTEAIEKDLHRTFPENVHFKNVEQVDPNTGEKNEEESALLQTLRRVLKCFAMYKPSIGYCQSLNFIAGLLLMFMDEEKAFWMLVIISERYLPGIHDFNLEGVSVHQGVLMLCLRQYLPEIWQLIVDTSDGKCKDGTNSFLYDLPTLSFCTTSWFMSVFIGVLPIETTLRVWDCLFYDNSRTIFQVALTIFRMMEPELRKIVQRTSREDNDLLSSELFKTIQNYPKKALDANKLMEECFTDSRFGGLTQEEVLKCKQYVINSRKRYRSLVVKRAAIGLKEEDRREMVENSEKLESDKIGLKTLNWNGRLNHRMRKLHHRLR